MNSGPYKQVLEQFFNALSLSEDAKKQAVILFKRKLANGLWSVFQNEFAPEEQEWVKNHPQAAADEPEVKALQEKILARHTKEEIQAATKPIFKKNLEEYLEFVSESLDEPTQTRLRGLIEKI